LVLGNLEGPLARKARRRPRTHSYRVNPALAHALARAGIRVVTLANNHLLDCGRGGVRETLRALAQAGVAPLGAGLNESAAHAPVCCQAGRWRVGLLGYYWNRRCAATADLPGSAMDPPAALAADIGRLRDQVDRVVVTFHWGVPYVREPAPADRAKACLAVDCGADVVIGHHPHIVQPFEIYRGRPIFYSVGNFVLGSGNSRAEGLLLGLRFDEDRTVVDVFPLYVKNRDPRVNYQPKVLRGLGADRLLERLAAVSGPSGQLLAREGGRGRLDLPGIAPYRGGEVPDA
jgi:poly-gamma-glutamate capsule biosynthesis protein CapA/YwtB (metallophosphatase superfamily)